ncbi:MAG: hypothetical protein QGG64_27425 [Candidatus Latescibacteria bacterium]|jgi:hypothetical protein|nr:hypothetical protein [Candidatus Latescibacterota bacterium]
MFYQQGDVLIQQVDFISEDLEAREDGILAEGEATGHAHRVELNSAMIPAPFAICRLSHKGFKITLFKGVIFYYLVVDHIF